MELRSKSHNIDFVVIRRHMYLEHRSVNLSRCLFLRSLFNDVTFRGLTVPDILLNSRVDSHSPCSLFFLLILKNGWYVDYSLIIGFMYSLSLLSYRSLVYRVNFFPVYRTNL